MNTSASESPPPSGPTPPAPPPHRPPRVAAALLGWLLNDTWQTARGDFEEYFHEVVDERGPRRARWWYRGQVARLLPDRLTEKTYWNAVMLRNYVTLAYRNLLKNRAASAINLFGLSVAVGCALVAYLFVNEKFNREAVHENGAGIFLVEHIADENGASYTFGNAPLPLGPAMEADLPQVVRAVRLADGGGRVRYGDTELDEWIRFVDPGFLDMFTFPLQYGEPGALNDPDAVILSQQAAVKYFGDANPVGQTLLIALEGQGQVAFTVRGVAAPYSNGTSLRFHILLPYDRYPTAQDRQDDWSAFTHATFVQVERPEDIAGIAAQMDRYRALQNAADDERAINAFVFENLYDLIGNSSNVRSTIAGTIPWAPIVVLSVIAAFMLTLSCLNYMNIALATAARRLKEIGVRKVLGSNRAQLVGQFLIENTMLCLVALLTGAALAHGFLVPAFNHISGSEMTLLTTNHTDLWFFLSLLLLGIGVTSGLYPALYIASFQPVAIFTGKQKLGRPNAFMQGFLTLQFVLAFITMIASVALIMNERDQLHRDWGYDHEHTLVVPLRNPAQYPVLKDAAGQLPGVISVAGSHDHLGRSHRSTDVTIDGEPFNTRLFDVAPAYLETLGLRLKAGQFLQETGTVVINETFARARDWTEPLNQTLRLDSMTYRVAGVVEDFHYFDFSTDIDPVLFRRADESTYGFLSVRVEPGTGVRTAEALETTWRTLAPDVPFDFFFQDTLFDNFYRETRGITNIFTFTAILALLISCMGLFGLAAQNTASRMKEMTIRKILGASISHVARLANRRFLLLLALAALVATPVSYFLINALLGSIYTYHIGVQPASFLAAYVLILGIALLTVSTQIRKLATASPAEVLRND